MLGYLHDRPGEFPSRMAGNDTGDIVSIDEDGYLAIRETEAICQDRRGDHLAYRGGKLRSALWPGSPMPRAVRDERRGESIVLVTTNPEASRSELIAWVRNHGVPELAVPRRVIPVTDVPVLGTGKTDYVGVAKIVAKTVETPLERSARS
jgi:acyl-[acyl-carrier-protein]-phospholipid O-acyltransferase/long-chain-fatty-acid--[acyl-carrier-protein] ligase